MKKPFSLVKALKVGLTSLALAGSCLMASTASAQHYSTRGTQIVDGSGNPVFFNGTNLGNWLVWEGYLMMGDYKYRSHTEFFWGLETAFGTTKALEFERLWRENYVTEATIEELRGLGYNSVRVPFKWSLLWNGSSLNAEGIRYIDNLISWCKPRGIKILLDMHGLPGYQNPGDHSDNIDAKEPPENNKDLYQYTVKFLEPQNYVKAGDAWRAIAAKYAEEPTIWGYDIMNEPKSANNSGGLLQVQKYIIGRIREVDTKHIVVVEGDHWASYMDMYNVNSSGWNGSILDPKSSKVVLQTHHYISGNLGMLGELDKRAKIARDMNVPIILGEIGEDTEPVLRELALRAKSQQYSGVYSWSFKKMFHEYRSLWAVVPTRGSAPDDAYLELRDAILQYRTFNGNWENLKAFLTSNIRNGHKDLHWWQKFHDNTGGALQDSTPTPPSSSGLSGTYKICSKGTLGWAKPECLDVEDGQFRTENGTPIQQWEYKDLQWQQWKIVPLGGDNYQIISVYSNKSMDLRGGETADWGQSRPQLYDTVPNHPNQTWKIQYNASRGVYTIKSFVRNAAGLEIGLDVPGGSTENGKDLQFWTFYEGNPNQEWILTKLY